MVTSEEITDRGVLVADSAPNMAALVSIMLRSIGRKDIREVYDADHAMRELNRRAFSAVIIDDNLEGMDGVAFTRKLRSSEDCPNRLVPIIMMSALPDTKRIAQARDAGVTEFLRKPFAANHLLTRLTSIDANPRGFIEAVSYTGPDRRRKTIAVGDKDRRDVRKPAPGDQNPS